jgi:hypothetical protein
MKMQIQSLKYIKWCQNSYVTACNLLKQSGNYMYHLL